MVDHPQVEFAEPLQQIDRTHVLWRGKKLLYFGGCDYFRLSNHPKIVTAVKEAVGHFGLNVAASRFTTGNHELYGRLEAELCRFFRAEAATVVSNGYATNLIVAQALTGDFSHALVDSRAHHSLRDCLRHLNCKIIEFRHRDVSHFSMAVRKCGHKARILVLTDGLFSHDGSLAPLREYAQILPHGSKLLLDDAHGAGTVGPNGRGTTEALGIQATNIIQTISLSKAFGVYGGAILGTRDLRQKILNKSNLVKGNTPLPLPLAYAAICALKLVRSDQRLRQRLQHNARYAHAALSPQKLLEQERLIPIISVLPSGPATAQKLRRRLLREGILPIEIRYQENSSTFRFAISSEHSRAQLDALIRACAAGAK